MPPRARPEGCCPVRPIEPLPEGERERMLRIFKALADATRFEILRLVGRQSGPTCVCDIVDHFDLRQPTISHHLKVLKDAGLLRASKLGIWSFYEADPEGLAALEAAARATRAAE